MVTMITLLCECGLPKPAHTGAQAHEWTPVPLEGFDTCEACEEGVLLISDLAGWIEWRCTACGEISYEPNDADATTEDITTPTTEESRI